MGVSNVSLPAGRPGPVGDGDLYPELPDGRFDLVVSAFGVSLLSLVSFVNGEMTRPRSSDRGLLQRDLRFVALGLLVGLKVWWDVAVLNGKCIPIVL